MGKNRNTPPISHQKKKEFSEGKKSDWRKEKSYWTNSLLKMLISWHESIYNSVRQFFPGVRNQNFLNHKGEFIALYN